MVDFKHGKICYIFMPSQDPENSGAFYRDVFGWTTRTDGEGGLSFDDSTGQVVRNLGHRSARRQRAQPGGAHHGRRS